MWKPKKIVFKDFLSHAHSEYEFVSGVATMIYGVNSDDEAQESNGSGKSVMIEAMAFGLTGDSLRGVRAVELIKDGSSMFEVEIELYNSRFKRNMIINRKQPAKGSSKVKVIIDGKDQKDKIPTVRVADEFIADQLDIIKEDLFNYFIISKDKYESFFAFGDVKKKQVVARFSNAVILDPAVERVQEDKKAQSKIVEMSENSVSNAKTQIATINDAISKAEISSGLDSYKAGIATLKERISKGEKILVEQETKVKLASEKLSAILKSEVTVDTSGFDEKLKQLNENKSKLKDQKDKHSQSIKDAEKFIQELELVLHGAVHCPKCNHEFTPNSETDPKEAKETLPEAKELVIELNECCDKVRNQISAIELDKETTITKRRLSIEKQSKWKIEKATAQSELSAQEKMVEQYENGLITLNHQLKNYPKPVDPTDNLKRQLKLYKDALKDAEKDLKQQEDIFKQLCEVEHLFKRFKTHLANKAIRAIEAYTTYYLTQIKTNLGLRLSGYKMKADGTLSEKISSIITRNGEMIGPFSRFSGGEKVRVEICNIVALQNLINLNAKSGGLDLLCLDEIIESVDSKGVVEVMKALNLLERTVLVITHTTHTSVYDNVVIVEKRNGNSQIRK